MKKIKSNVPAWNNGGAAKTINGTFAAGIWIPPPEGGEGLSDAFIDVTLGGTIVAALELQVIPSKDGGATSLAAIPNLNSVVSNVANQGPGVHQVTTGGATRIGFWVKLLPSYSYNFQLRGTSSGGDSTAIATVDLFVS